MMLATDLDGTLLRPDSSVSQRTKDALKLARDSGLIVTLVTGRPPRWLAPVIHDVGWHGLAIAANGAVLIDLERQRIEEADPIPASSLLHAVQTIRDLIPGVAFGVEHARVGDAIPLGDPRDPATYQGQHESPQFGQEPHYRGYALPAPAVVHAAPIETHIHNGAVIKLLARGPIDGLHDPDDIAGQVADVLRDVVTVTHSTTSAVLLEMSNVGVSKATGLARLAAHHGVEQANVIAVGDMPNDLPMLRWAGRGLAVANAHSALLGQVGDFNVIGANGDDGVARFIEQLVASASTRNAHRSDSVRDR
jgi:hydroxymethylpyrimidine pyrophosphatase-like HAD family hydrolase